MPRTRDGDPTLGGKYINFQGEYLAPPVNPEVDVSIEQRVFLKRATSAAGFTLNELSKRIGRGGTYLQQFIKEGKPGKLRYEDAVKIGDVIGVEPTQLMPAGAQPFLKAARKVADRPVAAPVEGARTKSNTVPLFHVESKGNGLYIKLEEDSKVTCPPGADAPGMVYAFVMPDLFAAPRFDSGERVYVYKNRQPSIGDFAVVDCNDGTFVVGRVTGRTARHVRVEIIGIEEETTFENDQVDGMYLIPDIDDLMG